MQARGKTDRPPPVDTDAATVVAVDPQRPSAGTVKATTAWLRQARLELSAAGPSNRLVNSAAAVLGRLEAWLQRPPRIAVMGEANAGKTSLINLILGVEGLPSGVLANTRLPTLVVHGATPAISGRRRDGSIVDAGSPDVTGLVVQLPIPLLRDLELVDCATVGVTTRIAPADFLEADGVVWCTVMTQAWRNTERKLWLSLPPRLLRSSLLAVTFADLVDEQDERDAVVERVQREIGSSMQAVVPIGTRDALEALAMDAAAPGPQDALRATLIDLRDRIALQRAARARILAARFAERTLRNLERTL